jgi:hypothetical protein
MGISVIAGAESVAYWNDTAREFSADSAGVPFRIRTLDYFTAQAVLAYDEDVDRVRACIEAGLVSIDGSATEAEGFKLSPLARVCNPLFDAIWSATWGNSEAQTASE